MNAPASASSRRRSRKSSGSSITWTGRERNATAFLAASVVSLFEETIASNTALGVLLPVVAGQSGNLGSQALAVVIRALALREIRVRQWLQVCPRS